MNLIKDGNGVFGQAGGLPIIIDDGFSADAGGLE
jgi:hypothetical protein